jgi:hypothetical protein
MRKLHIGFHKTGSSFLQSLIFPNCKDYKGKLYEKGVPHNHKKYQTGSDYETGRNILKNQDIDWFISDEIYTRMKPQELVQIVKEFRPDKVLIVKRYFDDIIKSRRDHKTPRFYLMKKILDYNLDSEVRYHYDYERLSKDLSKYTDVTLLSYEGLFTLDKKEIESLCDFCDADITDLMKDNINIKVNDAMKRQTNTEVHNSSNRHFSHMIRHYLSGFFKS